MQSKKLKITLALFSVDVLSILGITSVSGIQTYAKDENIELKSKDTENLSRNHQNLKTIENMIKSYGWNYSKYQSFGDESINHKEKIIENAANLVDTYDLELKIVKPFNYINSPRNLKTINVLDYTNISGKKLRANTKTIEFQAEISGYYSFETFFKNIEARNRDIDVAFSYSSL
ncbi:hypothetical protein ACA758_04580 [Mycoplasmopsis agassizii]|uniref:hypothetical protein n=1 Tax=Mycoplasmopsis agassizii TaxID=33922 RepID=UPI003529CED6